jgi:hypothetical protein
MPKLISSSFTNVNKTNNHLSSQLNSLKKKPQRKTSLGISVLGLVLNMDGILTVRR